MEAPAGFKPLLVSSAGILHSYRRNENGSLSFAATQDNTAILDANKAKATHNDGYDPTRTLRRVADIPLSLWLHWKHVEGWDCFDPHNKDRLTKVLNDPDYAHLRTAPGRIGYSNGVMR